MIYLFIELLKGRHGFRPSSLASETYLFVHSPNKNVLRATVDQALPQTPEIRVRHISYSLAGETNNVKLKNAQDNYKW